MNHHEQRAIDRVVSSKVWIEKSKSAGFARDKAIKKRQIADALKIAEWDKERQEYGVFLEIKDAVNSESMCDASTAWKLEKGEPVFFSQPKIYNAAKKLILKVLDYDAANNAAVMIDQDGKIEVYEVKYAANMLRIQLLKHVLDVAVHPKNGDSSQNM